MRATNRCGHWLSWAAFAGMVCGWESQAEAAMCVVRSTRHRPGVGCSCDPANAFASCNGELTFSGWDEDWVEDAVPGERGYDVIWTRHVYKTTAHPCVRRIDYVNVIILTIAFQLCTEACAAVVTPPGAAGCAMCIGAALGTGVDICTIYYCAPDYDQPVHRTGYEIVQMDGDCLEPGT